MKPARAWVRLQSGRRLNLLEPDPGSWTESDLAIGLARTYRWGGHSCWPLPLSVAQHSLLVMVLRQRLRPLEPLTRGDALRELLHDADEGLLSYDPISSIKPHLGADFRALAERMQTAVQTRYRLQPWDEKSYAIHKQADRLAAACEALHVAGWSAAELHETLDIDIPPLMADPLPAPHGMRPWEPWPARTAAALFLAKLQELTAPGGDRGQADLTDITAAIERERTLHELAQAFTRLPSGHRFRCGRPPTGNSLTDTFVLVEAGDHSASIEGVIVNGERDEDGAWDFDAPFTVLTTDQELIVCRGDCHVESSDVLRGLTAEQAHAATLTGPVLVLAGAGTGKTKTLTAGVTHRIAVRGIPAHRILTVTFTNKAAGEMRGRIQAALGEGAAPTWLGTFHGLGARQLRVKPEVAGLRPGFDIVDADDSRRMIKRLMKAMNLAVGDDAVSIGRDPLKLICNKVSAFKDALVTPDEAAAYVETKIAEANHAGLPVDPNHLRAAARVYVEYQRVLRDGNAADFGDLLLWPVRAMRENAAYLDRWAGRFDALLGDEYQDVNHAQYTWLRLLGKRHREVFAVGDDDQAVYSWRGSDLRYLRRFAQDFPGAAQVRLEENFRSTGHILATANAVIARDRTRLGKTLYTRKPEGHRLEVIGFRTAEAEALGIAAEIQRRHATGGQWQDFAILYRSNAQSRGYEEALMRCLVPYVLIGDLAFYQRAEIKDSLAFLRLADTPDSPQADEAFRRVINVPARGFGPKAVEAVEAEAAWRQVSLLQALETAALPPKARSSGLAFADAIRAVERAPAATVADQISLLLDATGYRTMLRDSRAETTEDKLENVQELIALAGRFHTVRELLDHATLSTNGPQDETADRVRLMTIHKGKGLEFPHVFLPAWEAGTFPSSFGDPAEERRLAYVAITRGMRRVTISHCGFRHGPTSASPFLDDIPEADRVQGWLHGQTTTGDMMTAPGGTGQRPVAELTRWR